MSETTYALISDLIADARTGLDGLQHRLQLNPSEQELREKPVRGSDVPLFWGKGKDCLGMEIKTVYNRCMNLLVYKPRTLSKNPLAGSELEQSVIELIKQLKHNKEDYSSTWKENFKKYKHTLVGANIAYNDKDPFDDNWMKHELLERSPEMQEAAAIYLQQAEEVLRDLDETMHLIEHALGSYAIANAMTMDDWAQSGENMVMLKLARAQNHVDKILLNAWKLVEPALGELFAGIQPSYIGSTNTGQKSVTKAYVQFNPDDFDVDGQLKAPMLYMALADLGVNASKGRFFVRQVIEPAMNAILVREKATPRISSEEEARIAQLKRLLMRLFKYVQTVEKALTTEIRGVMADPNDPFDLAIVMG